MKNVLRQLYFDYNATTPILPRVANKIHETLISNYGNPSSTHELGRRAYESIHRSRTQIANLINSETREIIFTSNATESNNLSILGTMKDPDDHLITCKTEHPAVIGPAKILEKMGHRVTYLPVNKNGLINLKELKESITHKTKLITIMTANNETGVIQDIEAIGQIAKEKNILFHTDASQAVGKIKINVKQMNIDLMTVAGHKFYAPKGIGALFIRKEIPDPKSLMTGGGQERGIRPGTENVPYIVGLGEACELASEDMDVETQRQYELGSLFVSLLRDSEIKDFIIHAESEKRLPNTCSIGFGEYISGQIINQLKELNVFVSAGAACHESDESISDVLKAMNVEKKYALGTIRFSWGRPTTIEDIYELVERLKVCFKILNKN